MDPCTIIGALATVAGTAASMVGQQEAQDASNRAVSAELARQSEYQRKALREFQASLEQSTPEVAQQQMATGEQERNADYAKTRSVPLTEAKTPFAASVSQRLMSPTSSGAQDRLSDAARARMAGYTEWDLQQAIKNLHADQAINQIGNFSRGSSFLLPLDLQSASHAGASWGAAGSLLGAAGNLGMTYGASHPSAPTATMTSSWQGPTSEWDSLLGMYRTPVKTGFFGLGK